MGSGDVYKRQAVSRSGYLGFGDGDVGDHRCLWVDITNRSLLGFLPAELTKASERRVTTKHPWVVRQYNAIYESHDQRFGICDQLQRLDAIGPRSLTVQEAIEYTKAERLATMASKDAKKRCRLFARVQFSGLHPSKGRGH